MLCSVVNRVSKWFGDALPCGFGKLTLIGSIGEGGKQGFHQGLMGGVAVGLLLLQLVAEGHQFIDFGDDAVLFGEEVAPQISHQDILPK